MEKQEILSRISQLNPSNFPISQALAFLRIVVENNPTKPASDIAKRTDVKSAQKVINDWVDEVQKLMDEAFSLLPRVAARALVASIYPTLQGFKDEVNLTESRIGTWKLDQTKEISIAKIILRMNWTLEWLSAQLELSDKKGKWKTWNCRMAPNSCTWCKGLNGTTIRNYASFKATAKKLGWKRPYGGLFAPPLHPSCKCYLTFSSEPPDTNSK